MPSTSCCAVGCKNNPLRNPDVRFHQFPKDPDLKKVWVEAVRRVDFGKPWTPTSRSKLCSDHFTLDSYERDLRLLAAAGFSLKSARLKRDAVPSLFAHRPPAVPARTAYLKRRRIETVSQALALRSSTAASASLAEVDSALDIEPSAACSVTGTQAPSVICGSKGVQTEMPGYRCKAVQVSGGGTKSKFTQSSVTKVSTGTQTTDLVYGFAFLKSQGLRKTASYGGRKLGGKEWLLSHGGASGTRLHAEVL